MNVYDAAHNLKAAIQQSEEFKQFEAAQKKVEEHEGLNQMIQDFNQKQMEIQMQQMMGNEMDPEMMQSLQQLYAIVMQNPVAAEYLQCQMRYSLMMADVSNILGEVTGVKEVK